jgi:hypothetical protein
MQFDPASQTACWDDPSRPAKIVLGGAIVRGGSPSANFSFSYGDGNDVLPGQPQGTSVSQAHVSSDNSPSVSRSYSSGLSENEEASSPLSGEWNPLPAKLSAVPPLNLSRVVGLAALPEENTSNESRITPSGPSGRNSWLDKAELSAGGRSSAFCAISPRDLSARSNHR